ncbi:MAG: hypothetical protein HKM24_05980 [Gammaproteobacteria bacterium]|nr:hypothetical protein [Gammaproteobacteria bacterium]
MSQSIFSLCLQGLLETGPHPGGWDGFLQVPPGTNEQWLADQAIPLPTTLYLLYVTCQGHVESQAAVCRFDEMSHVDARAISPLGKLMLPTVAVYVNRELDDDVGVVLSRLVSNQEKERFLEHIYPRRF